MEMMCKSVNKLTKEQLQAIGGFIPQKIAKVLNDPDVPAVNKASFKVLWIKGQDPVFYYDERNLDDDPQGIVDYEYEQEERD